MTDEGGVGAPESILRTSQEIASTYSRSSIRQGDLVCSIGPSFGKVMITPGWLEGANLTQGTARIAVKPPHHGEFVFWVLRSLYVYAQWESSVGGATFRALNLGPLTETWLVVPPDVEQEVITRFLDHETAKMDALIAQQERLIKLLQEKRQAIISQAVTKGLNPDAPMKPSGVEWLGDVPAHWEIVPIKRIAKLVTGLTPPSDQDGSFSEDGLPWLTPGDLDESGSPVRASRFLSSNGQRFGRAVDPGSTLVCCIGTIGKLGFVDSRVSTNQQITAVEFAYAHKYWFYSLSAARSAMEMLATGNVLRILNSERLGSLRLPLPPGNEADEIARQLDDQARIYEEFERTMRRGIELLLERRSALIFAAVTGQIDVRGLVEQTAA